MTAGVEISLRIGQRVHHHDTHDGKRVTGIVRGLSVDGEDNTLKAHFVLDAPIVTPEGHGFAQFDIWHQTVPAHELSPFDEREELIVEMAHALNSAHDEMRAMRAAHGAGLLTDKAIAAAATILAKFPGGAS